MSILTAALNSNKSYTEKLLPALKNLVNDKHHYIFEADCGLRRVWQDQTKTHYFMFYQNMNTISIFCEKKVKGMNKRSSMINYYYEEIKNDELKIYNATLKVLLNPNEDNSLVKKEIWNETNEAAKKSTSKQLVWAMYENMKIDYGTILDSSSIKEHLDTIHDYLIDKAYLDTPIVKEDWETTGQLLAGKFFVADMVKELTQNLNKIMNLANELNLNQYNQFKYNDDDNCVWIPELTDSICISNQDINFIATKKNKSWQVYHYNTDYSQYHSEKEIIRDIIKGNLSVNDRVLFVQEGKPIYVGNYLECLLDDTGYAITALKEHIAENKKSMPNKTNHKLIEKK